ncbi:MAG: hypothetical protein R2758_14250 [Bacteroidales bacterium]|jgi:tRNA modification GTPase
MERTRVRLRAADIVLAVAEATDSAPDIAGMADAITAITGSSEAHIILVVNKSDLLSPDRIRELRSRLQALCSCPLLFVSARNSSGIDDIREQLVESVETGRLDNPQYIVTNTRHFEALKNVSESLGRVLDGFRDGIPTVLIATDVRQAIYHLGLITGQVTPDDILGEIFSRFCIGK